MNIYYNSVGHNSNLLLGVVVDRNGLVPYKDVQVLKELGQKIKDNFSNAIATTCGSGSKIEFDLNGEKTFNQIVLREDITNGHCVHNFQIVSIFGEKSKVIASAKVIGNKRVFRLKRTKADKLILQINDFESSPNITEFSAFNVDFKLTFKQKLKLIFKGYM